MVPKSPTAQTSLAPLPQTPLREVVVPLNTRVQALPSQWSMVPASPTGQTSFAPAESDEQDSKKDFHDSTFVFELARYGAPLSNSEPVQVSHLITRKCGQNWITEVTPELMVSVSPC